MKILIGGSPCTHWSIAQTNNRETEPEGLGWELFKNYLIAKEKFKPDYFLYENNKSAAQPIKDQISKELGVDLMHINSALVSAQNRQRFYAFNWKADQPEDRGILLKDILESGLPRYDKSPCIDANYYKGGNFSRPNCQSGQRMMCDEPVCASLIEQPYGRKKLSNGKYDRRFEARTDGKSNALVATRQLQFGMLAEPVGVAPIPINITKDGKSQTIKAQYQQTSIANICCYSSTYGASGVAEPVPCGQRQQDKSRTITAGYQTCSQRDLRMDIETDGFMGKQGVIEILPYYAMPIEWDENGKPTKAISGADGKIYTVYEVKDGFITIRDKQYPIKLPDGFYIIRKLTVKECARLQTIPDWYEFPVSDSQAYKLIGNGWTIEVIKYLLSHIPNIQNEEIEVLSMYDGMSCGQIALKELGCHVSRYYATEIDKFAIQTTQHNFPNTIQLGDAFQVRDSGWHL